MNPVERAALLQGLKQALPYEAYDAMIREAIGPSLKPGELRNLELQGLAA